MGNEPIKVLHIDSEKGWRGGQQQVSYLLKELVQKGYDTKLICQPRSRLEDFCREHHLPVRGIRMFGEGDLVSAFRIAILCQKENFKILHCHSAHALSIGIWVKMMVPFLKVIGVRRVNFHIRKNWFSQLKYGDRYVDKIVCISDGIKKVLLNDGISEKRLITIKSGVDLRRYRNSIPTNHFKKELGIPEHHLVVGTVAAMVKHKDYPNLLKAAKRFSDQSLPVTFCAVGDGPERKEIVRIAQDLGLGNRFVFTGFIEDIGQILHIFDIFVLASKEEGLGTSILNAQSLGLPVIATNTGGIPEAVVHNINGLLVPPRDSEALFQGLLKLVQNPTLREKLGRRGLMTVKKFDIKYTVKKNIELYRALGSKNSK